MVSIIIPTWNSMPELGECLSCIKKAFVYIEIDEIIVIDRYSTDGTIEAAKKHGCKILLDNISLGSARMRGINEAKSELVVFIDSDIELPEGWFDKMIPYLDDNVGMIYGRAVDTDEKLMRYRQWKIKKGIIKDEPVQIRKGERGYTNNTIIRKKLIKDIDMSEINAWEDWIITQKVINSGYKVLEVPVDCRHNNTAYNKFRFIKSGWNTQGALQVVGFNWYIFKYINYWLLGGIRATLIFKDLWYLKYGFTNWLEAWTGILMPKKFSRGGK